MQKTISKKYRHLFNLTPPHISSKKIMKMFDFKQILFNHQHDDQEHGCKLRIILGKADFPWSAVDDVKEVESTVNVLISRINAFYHSNLDN
ncbi:MAG: hypothetical protein H6625_10620 [Bdellovibrionaceae bacterium]|nr:hypothetical protein [Pseudobdellovibrionaceae bacterium]